MQTDDHVYHDDNVGDFKCYHHSDFYQGIADPMTLDLELVVTKNSFDME